MTGPEPEKLPIAERAVAALDKIQKLITDHRIWLANGLPPRPPITPDEVNRRIDLWEEAKQFIRKAVE